jgi:hypothetical protein
MPSPRRGTQAALAEVMDKVPGYESAVRLLVGFMIGPKTRKATRRKA